MRDIPNVLIIEKSRFPANVPVEECERVGKTPDNKNAIIRYQRRADVGVVKQIGRFFSDLIKGVTRAKGIVCDKPELPATLHIRGERFNITKEAGSNKAMVAPPSEGQARPRAAISSLTIEVHQVALRKCDPALAHKVAEELRDRFEAVGQAADRQAVEYFLELDGEPNFDVTPVHLVRLLHFSDALGRMSGTLKKELGADVLAHVLDRMQHWQNRIGRMEVQGADGPVPAYPKFSFKGLSAFGAKPDDATPARPAPAQPAPAPDMRPGPAEALHQPQPQAQLQPQPQSQVQSQAQTQPQAQAQSRPLPQSQPKPQPQAQPQPQPQPQRPPAPQPQARTQTQTPVPEQEPVLAPPPPPPPPPAIKPAGNPAAPTAGLDTNELASVASRLKPASTNPPKAAAPKAKDDSAASILAQVMAQRRVNLKEDVNEQQDGNDDEWK